MEYSIDQIISFLNSFKAGKNLEFRCNCTWWEDIKDLNTLLRVLNDHNYTVRVKASSEFKPYETSAEFLKAQAEHGPYLESRDMPGVYYLPSVVKFLEVNIPLRGNVLYSNLLEQFVWAKDRTLCGKRVDS